MPANTDNTNNAAGAQPHIITLWLISPYPCGQAFTNAMIQRLAGQKN
jgi:hypothetical protein